MLVPRFQGGLIPVFIGKISQIKVGIFKDLTKNLKIFKLSEVRKSRKQCWRSKSFKMVGDKSIKKKDRRRKPVFDEIFSGGHRGIKPVLKDFWTGNSSSFGHVH